MVVCILEVNNMDTNYYLDIRIINAHDDADLKLPILRNQIYGILHGIFRQIPHTFALALASSARLHAKKKVLEIKYGQEPKYDFDILRVFSATEESLEQLTTELEKSWKVRDYAILLGVRTVPKLKITGWKSYRRFRIPTAKAERTKLSSEPKKSLHQRRLDVGRNLPYFLVRSQSTGQQFTVNVDIQDAQNQGTGEPDSYGLARTSAPFALPVWEEHHG